MDMRFLILTHSDLIVESGEGKTKSCVLALSLIMEWYLFSHQALFSLSFWTPWNYKMPSVKCKNMIVLLSRIGIEFDRLGCAGSAEFDGDQDGDWELWGQDQEHIIFARPDLPFQIPMSITTKVSLAGQIDYYLFCTQCSGLQLFSWIMKGSKAKLSHLHVVLPLRLLPHY